MNDNKTNVCNFLTYGLRDIYVWSLKKLDVQNYKLVGLSVLKEIGIQYEQPEEVTEKTKGKHNYCFKLSSQVDSF